MPFVTEALWAAIPHRSTDPGLLIVARWPGAGARDEMLEADVDALIELVRGVRNARAEADIEPRAWLSTEVSVPAAMGPTFEALRPAIERLTHARPLTRRLTREALGDGAQLRADEALSVITGDLEAVVHRPTTTADPAAAAAERSRLERELAEAERHLAAARGRLANDDFTDKAPESVVAGARATEASLADHVDRLRDRLGSTGGRHRLNPGTSGVRGGNYARAQAN